MSIRLLCAPCDKNHDCNRCARTVRAFIEPEGPDWYQCECYCNQKRRRKADADYKVREIAKAYRREFGEEAFREVLGIALSPS